MRSHLPLVRAVARRYGGRGEDFEDLVQVGALGLVKASGRFDPSRGVAFASFAAPAVEGEIRRHLHERGPGLRLPRETQRMTNELRRCESELAAALGRSPTAAELAAALSADIAEVERLIIAGLARDPAGISGGDAQGEPSSDLESTDESEARVLLAGGLRALDERERRIVFLRFHADMTERQIAQAMGISQAHVSRLLDGALTKLRAELTDPTEPAASGDSAQIEAISPSKIASVGAEEKGQDENTAGEATPTGRRSSKPRANAGYSGRILVRMPSELHEQLAAAAEREEISLNRYVNDALTNSVEASDDEAVAGDDRGAKPSRLSPRGLRVALATNLAIVVVAGVVAVVLLVLALQRGI